MSNVNKTISKKNSLARRAEKAVNSALADKVFRPPRAGSDLDLLRCINKRNLHAELASIGELNDFDMFKINIEEQIEKVSAIITKCPLMATAIEATSASLEEVAEATDKSRNYHSEIEALYEEVNARISAIAEAIEEEKEFPGEDEAIEALEEYSEMMLMPVTRKMLLTEGYEQAWSFYNRAVTAFAEVKFNFSPVMEEDE